MAINIFLVLEQALSGCPTTQYDSYRVPGTVPSVMSQEQQENSLGLHRNFFSLQSHQNKLWITNNFPLINQTYPPQITSANCRHRRKQLRKSEVDKKRVGIFVMAIKWSTAQLIKEQLLLTSTTNLHCHPWAQKMSRWASFIVKVCVCLIV